MTILTQFILTVFAYLISVLFAETVPVLAIILATLATISLFWVLWRLINE